MVQNLLYMKSKSTNGCSWLSSFVDYEFTIFLSLCLSRLLFRRMDAWIWGSTQCLKLGISLQFIKDIRFGQTQQNYKTKLCLWQYVSNVMSHLQDIQMNKFKVFQINSFGWPDDDSLESKSVATCIILCNKLLRLTEKYIWYELHKQVGMFAVSCLLSTVYCLLSTVYCLLSVQRFIARRFENKDGTVCSQSSASLGKSK